MPSKDALIKEVEYLKKHLIELNSPIVFCHNDLLLKNIIYNEKTNNVSFIDFEYADYNYQALDIGNHFCEFVGVETFNPKLYPDKDFQKVWLRNYLESWFEIVFQNGIKENARNVTDFDVELLYAQVNKFALAAHLYWAFWAIVQAAHSTIDFDFLDYGKKRLDEYYNRRDEFLSIPVPVKSTKNGHF